jgi:hypothetical protein
MEEGILSSSPADLARTASLIPDRDQELAPTRFVA